MGFTLFRTISFIIYFKGVIIIFSKIWHRQTAHDVSAYPFDHMAYSLNRCNQNPVGISIPFVINVSPSIEKFDFVIID
jgi:hypothetical protein